MKTKLQSLGFTSGHMHLLLVAVAVFAILMVVKSDVNLKTMFANADDEQVMLTYDDVQNQTAAEFGPVADTELTSEEEEQYALLDRSLETGEVLGDATGIGTVPDAEQIFSRSQLDLINVNTQNTTAESIKKYSESLLSVESQNESVTLMANLNSSDSATLNKTKDQAYYVIQNLSALTVPSELADYHRYKMIYYQTLASMADSFAQNNLNTNFENTSKIFFSVTNKIEQTKAWVQDKYNVAL